MKVLLIFLAAIGLVFVLLVAVLLGGWYNVAASQPHTSFTSWALDTIADRSIENHAEDVRVPNLSGVSVETGFRHYQGMCVVCHGAPGVERSEIGRGLTPRPPHLQEEAKEFDDRQLFWIVKNGIKMTGMPAFGQTHTDEDLWAIVAFVKKLPDMTADEYQALSGAPAKEGGPAADHHAETAGHSH